MQADKLFEALRKLNGSLSQIQVDGINAILEACNKHSVTSDMQISYILATAAEIIVIGMKNGLFTGKKLCDYFCAGTEQPIAARKIINGQDKAELIAGYYKTILSGITHV